MATSSPSLCRFNPLMLQVDSSFRVVGKADKPLPFLFSVGDCSEHVGSPLPKEWLVASKVGSKCAITVEFAVRRLGQWCKSKSYLKRRIFQTDEHWALCLTSGKATSTGEDGAAEALAQARSLMKKLPLDAQPVA